ncbi:peptidase C39 family protein, partial [Pseudomonas aeruginosa]|uniref:peptidase C39 family protein n=1 Tax=Pseudomonas aeruginosa TaxID=287 RepID=UPI003D722D1C
MDQAHHRLLVFVAYAVEELDASGVEQKRSARLDIPRQLARGGQPLVLISSYRLTRSKAPHWVLVTHYDEDFVYLH